MEDIHRCIHDEATELAEEIAANRHDKSYLSNLNETLRELIEQYSEQDDETMKRSIFACIIFAKYSDLDEEMTAIAKSDNRSNRNDATAILAEAYIAAFFENIPQTAAYMGNALYENKEVESELAYSIALHEACVMLPYATDDRRPLIRSKFAETSREIYRQTNVPIQGELAKYVALVMESF